MKRALILVVDDDPQILTIVRRVLSDPSYKVLATIDPFEAARLLGSEKLHLVISDLEMPGIDGHASMRRAKTSCSGAVRIRDPPRWIQSRTAGPITNKIGHVPVPIGRNFGLSAILHKSNAEC